MVKEVSQRQLRVGQEIRRVIAGLIERGEIRNLEGLDTMVTITEARVTPDLKNSNVYFVVSNPETEKEVLEGLNLAANHFRKQVAARTNLRYVPIINFRIDDSFAEVDRIEKLLRNPKVQSDLVNK